MHGRWELFSYARADFFRDSRALSGFFHLKATHTPQSYNAKRHGPYPPAREGRIETRARPLTRLTGTVRPQQPSLMPVPRATGFGRSHRPPAGGMVSSCLQRRQGALAPVPSGLNPCAAAPSDLCAPHLRAPRAASSPLPPTLEPPPARRVEGNRGEGWGVVLSFGWCRPPRAWRGAGIRLPRRRAALAVARGSTRTGCRAEDIVGRYIYVGRYIRSSNGRIQLVKPHWASVLKPGGHPVGRTRSLL